MSIVTEPKDGGSGRRVLVVVLLAVLVVAAIGIAVSFFARRPPEGPKGPPVAPRARTSPSPRATPAAPAPEARATPRAEPRSEAAGSTLLPSSSHEVIVRFKEVRLDERVDVVHKHGMDSCRGRLVATTAGLRYEADKAGDSFETPFPSLEPLQVDYLSRNLRVKQRGGKTWNFTAESADALLGFQKAVEATRKRM